MRALVTGAGGMGAREIVTSAENRNHDITALTHAELDVCDAAAVGAVVASVRPDVIINCAAWTDVDGAESNEAAALAVNGTAPGLLAAAANSAGARLVHISTDYVFDGRSARPYVESDETAPRSAYGRTKLAGEEAVSSAGGPHAIVRTSWLFGAGGRNFVATMLRLAAEGRSEVSVVDDQIGCPTFAGHLAAALVEIAERRLDGIMHVAGAGQCSWADFAAETFSQSGTQCNVRPVSTAEFTRSATGPRPAQRPQHSVLVSERADVPRLPPWQDGLAAYLTETREQVAR
jgi:dTDP-4-dehydrorhamnose reductase